MRNRDHRHDSGPCRHGPHPEHNDLAGKFEQCGRLIVHFLGKRRGQGRILRTLCQRGDMPQRELQDLLGIQAGSMSEIAAKLEDKGLIIRVRSQEDRRKVMLCVTEQGRAWAAQQNEETIRRRRAGLFSSLSPEEQKLLEGLLDKLLTDWSRRLDHGGREGRERRDAEEPCKIQDASRNER